MFMKVKPVREKWITSVRPHDLVAPCPDWSLPIEVARDRRKRKRTFSEEEERERRRLRKRTKISPLSRRMLESSFLDNSRPNTSQLASLAEKTNLERDVVRVWFANRRQKQKKQPSKISGTSLMTLTTLPATMKTFLDLVVRLDRRP